MSRLRLLLLALLLAVPAATGAAAVRDGDGSAPRFGRGTATIVTPTDRIVLRVEIARTGAQQQYGLMHRRSLPRDAGMVFLYGYPENGGFWMKNTLIPLDIAFFDERGRIQRIMRMTPCREDPCRIYVPGVAYRGALEVNAGSFRRWNVKRFAKILVRPTPTG
jgi:uncharacterized protein